MTAYFLILVFMTCGIHGDACSIAAVQPQPALYAALDACKHAGQSAINNYSAGDEASVTYTCVEAPK